MKQRWTWSLIVLGALIVGGCAYVEPRLGQLPQGGRLERVQASAQFRDGEFRNELASPRRRSGIGFFLAVIRGRFESRDRPLPPATLPVVKTDLAALPAERDTVVWLGHSSFFVQLGGQRLLIDPVFSDHAAPLPWMVPAFDGTSVYGVPDLPPIDAVLITHDHYDHLDYASMKALQAKTRLVIAGLGNGAHLQRWGYPADKIREVDWHTSVALGPELQIHVLPAQHYSGRFLQRNQSLWASYALQTASRRLYFSGDSGFGPHFDRIAQRFGSFDLVALDSGQYDARWNDIHMNPEEAAEAAQRLAARALLVAHAGRFSLARHAWDEPFERAVAASRGRPYRLLTPRIGEPIRMDEANLSFSYWWRGIGSGQSPSSSGQSSAVVGTLQGAYAVAP